MSMNVPQEGRGDPPSVVGSEFGLLGGGRAGKVTPPSK